MDGGAGDGDLEGAGGREPVDGGAQPGGVEAADGTVGDGGAGAVRGERDVQPAGVRDGAEGLHGGDRLAPGVGTVTGDRDGGGRLREPCHPGEVRGPQERLAARPAPRGDGDRSQGVGAEGEAGHGVDAAAEQQFLVPVGRGPEPGRGAPVGPHGDQGRHRPPGDGHRAVAPRVGALVRVRRGVHPGADGEDGIGDRVVEALYAAAARGRAATERGEGAAEHLGGEAAVVLRALAAHHQRVVGHGLLPARVGARRGQSSARATAAACSSWRAPQGA